VNAIKFVVHIRLKTHKFDMAIFFYYITILCIVIYCLFFSCRNLDMNIFIKGWRLGFHFFRVFNPSRTLRIGLLGDRVGFRPIKVSGFGMFSGWVLILKCGSSC
jgi:hypothetical protein